MNAGTVPYPVVVGHALLGDITTHVPSVRSAHRVGIVTDTTVAALHLDPLRASIAREVTVVTIPAGERAKTRETWASITDTLQAAGFGRDSVLLALGGGVIGDLTGFVAATYQRGIPFVQLPTTLLAMVDASIGGKTGVDTPLGKNLVGAFHEPVAVICDLDTLATLPDVERRSGLAEVLKHGLIADAAYLDAVSAMLPWPMARADLERMVRGSVRVKTDVVARDLREAGVRKILNFGHTIGHAVEHLLAYAQPHGECVAIGMVVESRIAVRLGVADASLVGRVIELVQRAGLPHQVPHALTADAIIDATAHDKKARAGAVEYALPEAVGRMTGADRGYGTVVPRDVAREAITQSR